FEGGESMMKVHTATAFLTIILFVVPVHSGRSQQVSSSYGEPITLENALKAVALARAEAEKLHVHMAIAIVDPGGELVYFEKMDGTQTASVQVAVDKARSAALYRRPTKFFEDALAAGGEGWRFLGLRGAVPVDGGF